MPSANCPLLIVRQPPTCSGPTRSARDTGLAHRAPPLGPETPDDWKDVDQSGDDAAMIRMTKSISDVEAHLGRLERLSGRVTEGTES